MGEELDPYDDVVARREAKFGSLSVEDLLTRGERVQDAQAKLHHMEGDIRTVLTRHAFDFVVAKILQVVDRRLKTGEETIDDSIFNGLEIKNCSNVRECVVIAEPRISLRCGESSYGQSLKLPELRYVGLTISPRYDEGRTFIPEEVADIVNEAFDGLMPNYVELGNEQFPGERLEFSKCIDPVYCHRSFLRDLGREEIVSIHLNIPWAAIMQEVQIPESLSDVDVECRDFCRQIRSLGLV